MRGFSKLTLVKTKLRSVKSQDRPEALQLASTARDMLLQLNDADLVECFAAKADRRMIFSSGLKVMFYKLAYSRLYFH